MTAGRDRFAAIALEHLARAVAADELGVFYRDVSARVRDVAGALDVQVAAPVAIPSLSTEGAEPLTTRLAASGTSIRARLGALTGLTVAQVGVRATGAVISQRRVR